jgi:Protein of unknown function (DUF4231)
MTQEDAVKYLEGQLEQKTASFSAHRNFYKRNCFYLTIITASLSAGTAFLIGASQFFDKQQQWLSLLALAASSSAAIVSAWEGFYRPREMWVNNTAVLCQLYELRSRLSFLVARDGSDLKLEVIDDFHERYQAALNGANEAWKTVRIPQPAQARGGPPAT